MNRLLVGAAVIAFVGPAAVTGQAVTRLVANPETVEVIAGGSARFSIQAFGADGRLVQAPLRISGARGGVRVESGRVTGLTAGEYQIFVSTVPEDGSDPVTLQVPVIVGWPAVSGWRS